MSLLHGSPSSLVLPTSSAAGEKGIQGAGGVRKNQAWLGGGRVKKSLGSVRACGSTEEAEVASGVLTGVLFQPFQELKNPLLQAPVTPSTSLARHRYSSPCEAAINEQINVEYSVSYIYHALFAYFDRDYVALPGMAKYFKESSEEEREHAEKFMRYQNLRGGRVQLHSILQPAIFDFDHPEKGDALYAMELALSLEKLTNEKLLGLHKVADENGDPQLQDFIETEFLDEQVEAIKRISKYVSQLRRVGKGHGVYHFDRVLLKEHDDGDGNGQEIA